MGASPLTRPLPVAVGALAVARLTRLVTTDEITATPRAAVQRWAEGTATRRAHPQLGYLAGCPWCLSPWIASGWAGLVIAAPGPAGIIGAVLAWSQIAGLLAEVT